MIQLNHNQNHTDCHLTYFVLKNHQAYWIISLKLQVYFKCFVENSILKIVIPKNVNLSFHTKRNDRTVNIQKKNTDYITF